IVPVAKSFLVLLLVYLCGVTSGQSQVQEIIFNTLSPLVLQFSLRGKPILFLAEAGISLIFSEIMFRFDLLQGKVHALQISVGVFIEDIEGTGKVALPEVLTDGVLELLKFVNIRFQHVILPLIDSF